MVRWVISKGPSPNANTVNSLLSAASSVCAYAVEERWLDRAPSWRRVRMRPGPCVRNAPPPYPAVARLVDHLVSHRADSWKAHRLAALVATIALTGIRRNESLYLRLDDVALGSVPSLRIDLAAQPRSRLKTPGSERRIPIPETLAELLGGWMPLAGPSWLFPGVRRVGPWVGGSASGRPLGALQVAARRVGIDHITWHSLRHCYGTAAVERWGVPLWALQRLMGHTDFRTTQRYLHLDGSPEIAAATRGIRFRGD